MVARPARGRLSIVGVRDVLVVVLDPWHRCAMSMLLTERLRRDRGDIVACHDLVLLAGREGIDAQLSRPDVWVRSVGAQISSCGDAASRTRSGSVCGDAGAPISSRGEIGCVWLLCCTCVERRCRCGTAVKAARRGADLAASAAQEMLQLESALLDLSIHRIVGWDGAFCVTWLGPDLGGFMVMWVVE